jgi:hypothetical protein
VYNLKNGKNPEVGDIKAAIKAKESWIHKFKETHYKLVSDTIKFETLQDMSRIELISGSYVIPIDDNNPEPEVGEEESTISTIFPVPDFSDQSMTLERGPTVDSMSKIPIDTFTENFNNNMNIINRFVKLHDRSTKNEISKLENQITFLRRKLNDEVSESADVVNSYIAAQNEKNLDSHLRNLVVATLSNGLKNLVKTQLTAGAVIAYINDTQTVDKQSDSLDAFLSFIKDIVVPTIKPFNVDPQALIKLCHTYTSNKMQLEKVCSNWFNTDKPETHYMMLKAMLRNNNKFLKSTALATIPTTKRIIFETPTLKKN